MTVVEAIGAGIVGERLWFYTNYHCNLACRYCLTESGPRVPRRELGAERLMSAAAEAVGLGFTSFGVTGGEPFLLPYLPELLAELARAAPVVVLSNASMFGSATLRRMAPLAELPVAVQISLDSADPAENDRLRAAENFATVVKAIPRLVGMGLRVRVATTGGPKDRDGMARLCSLHRSLGVADDDHVVRPVVRRGRAVEDGLGIVAGPEDLPAELTITVDGAFWSPFGPTVQGGKLDTDLMVTRTIRPLRVAAEAMVRVAQGRPAGSDAALGIR